MITIITVLFLALAAMTVLHFVYEAIVLPSVRASRRFRLFALRDRLRNLRFASGISINDEAFSALDSSLSWQLENQHRLTFSMIISANNSYIDDKKFRSEVDRTSKAIGNCQIQEFLAIRQQAAEHMVGTIAWNCGGLLGYFLPPASVYFSMRLIMVTVLKVVVLPERDLERLAPQYA
ncbi:MAG TPA: hypothetical protein VFC28_01415 [Opitutaceae bacterium]|nr:hypothetical protein [Opitutaceae bacterium]